MASELSDCFCSLADLLGNAKSQVVSSMDALIALLSTLKAYLELINYDVEDKLRKIAYEAALAVLQEAGSQIENPFAIVMGFTGILSDCPPVASLAKILRDAKNTVLGPLDNLEYRVKQYIAALEDKNIQLKTLERWINTLTQARDKLDECGAS